MNGTGKVFALISGVFLRNMGHIERVWGGK